MTPFVDSTDLMMDGPALAARMDRDGYLFVKGLLPKDELRALRRAFLELADGAGWLNRDHDLMDAVANPEAACVDPQAPFLEVLRPFYVREDVQAIKHHPNIVALFERMFGEDVLVHPLMVIRNIFPQRPDFTTPAHQDYVHIQGTERCYTAWIPLHDCPAEMGGLQIAAGSHKAGVRDFAVSSGAGGLEVTDPLAGQWVGGSFAAGDAVIFHSLVVHKGSPNTTDRLRQSVDPRFQRASEPVCEVSMRPYADMFTWDEVYAGWQSTELQYYWEKQNPTVVPFDRRYYDRRDEMAFAMAEAGDETARAALMRIVQRDPRPDKVQRANDMLVALDAARTAAQ